MMDGGYHGGQIDRDFARIRQMLERLEAEALSWPHNLNAGEYRAVEEMTARGMGLKARLATCPANGLDELRTEISAWFLQANRALLKPAKRQQTTVITHLFGLLLFTAMWGIWVFNFQDPEYSLASIATASKEELARLGSEGLNPVILSVFPRVMLFSLLGTLLYLAGSLLRRNDKTSGLRHVVALACVVPIATLLSVFLAANLVTKARESMLKEVESKTQTVIGKLAEYMNVGPKAPAAAREVANLAAEAKSGLDSFGNALHQAESAFTAFIGTNEATVYFFAVVISAMLPSLLILLYSRLLNPPRQTSGHS